MMKRLCTCFCLLAATLAAPARAAEPAGPAMALPVEAVTVQPQALSRRITVVGSLRADEAIVLRPEMAGRITAIHFTEGQAVKAGAPLVQLDTEILSAERARAEADRHLAEVEFRRMSALLKRKAGSQTEYDQALSVLKVSEAELALAEARLAKARINAPFDGVLGLRSVSVGDYVAVGQDLVSLVASSAIKVDFRVPELRLAEVHAGQTLAVSVDALPGREFAGVLYAIDPQVDLAGRSLVLRARLDNPDDLLKPGLFARVGLEVGRREDALLVPEEALLPGADGSLSVYKVVAGKVVAARVVTGQRRDARVEITEGLAAGDTVITAGQMKVQPGMAVSVLPPTAAPAAGAQASAH